MSSFSAFFHASKSPRVVELEEDYLLKASMADLMLRASYDHGARVGLEAGRVIKPEPMDAENAAREFEALVLKEADKWATAGSINQDLPVFATARQILAAKKKRAPQDEGGAPRMETIGVCAAIASDIARIQSQDRRFAELAARRIKTS